MSVWLAEGRHPEHHSVVNPLSKRHSGVTRWRREPIDNESTKLVTLCRLARIGDTGSNTEGLINPLFLFRLQCCLEDNISFQLVLVNVIEHGVAGPLADRTDVTQRRASILQILNTCKHPTAHSMVQSQEPALA